MPGNYTCVNCGHQGYTYGSPIWVQKCEKCHELVGKKTENKNSDLWLSIRSNEMMRDTMRALIAEIKGYGIEYESYGSQKRLYLHLKNVPAAFHESLNNWVAYQPVSQLDKPPKVSDFDKSDW